jgi:hypothetical protein
MGAIKNHEQTETGRVSNRGYLSWIVKSKAQNKFIVCFPDFGLLAQRVH